MYTDLKLQTETTDSNLQFIREKIYQLRSAIMYSMSNELVKIPNNIVTAVKVDEEGHLWFVSKRPMQYVEQCEQTFPARLHFFRKGASFFVVVSGKATIVNKDLPAGDAAAIAEDYEKPVLIKMTMRDIEYTEPEAERQKNKIEILLENSYKWLMHTVAFHHHSKSVFQKLQQY